MAAKLIVAQAVDFDGNVLSGARLNVYDAGTTTRRAIYDTSDLDNEVSNPATATSDGAVVVWVDGDDGDFKVVLTNAAESETYYSQDNIPGAGSNVIIYPLGGSDQETGTGDTVEFAGLTLTGDLDMQGNRITLDDDNDSYLEVNGDDSVSIFVGGVEVLKLDGAAADKLILDGVSFSPTGATVGQALGYPNSANTLEPYTPAGGGDTLSAADEIITGQWSFNNGVIIGAVRWANVTTGDAAAASANLAAIQAEIDALPNSGGEVILPSGTVYIDGAINLRGSSNNKTNVTLRGQGKFQTTVYVDDSTGASGEWAVGGSGYAVIGMAIEYPSLTTFPYIVSEDGLTTNGSPKINNAGGYSVGATTINIDDDTGDGLVGRIGPGDSIEISGHAQRYIVQAAVTAASNELNGVEIYPALTTAVSDNEAVTIRQFDRFFGLTDGTSNDLMASGTETLRLNFNRMNTARVSNPAPLVGDQFFLVSENNPSDSDNYQTTVPYRISSVTAGSVSAPDSGSYAAGGYWEIGVEHWDGAEWVAGLESDRPNGIMVSNLQDYRNNIYNGLSLHHCDDIRIEDVWVKNARLHGISVGTSALKAPNAYRSLGDASITRSERISIVDCLGGEESDPTNTHIQGSIFSGGQLNNIEVFRCVGYGNRADTTPLGDNYNRGIFFEYFDDFRASNNLMARCQEGYRYTNFQGLINTNWTAEDCEVGFIQDQNGRGYVCSNFYVYSKDYASLTKVGVWARTGTPLTGATRNERDAEGEISSGIITGIGSASFGTNVGLYVQGAGTAGVDTDDIGFVSISGVHVFECYDRGLVLSEARKTTVSDCHVAYNGGYGYVEDKTFDVSCVNLRVYDNAQDRNDAGMLISDKDGGQIAGCVSKALRDATQGYGIQWAGTNTNIRIGWNNDFDGATGKETGTRPAMVADVRGGVRILSDQNSGLFSDEVEFFGLDSDGDEVQYAGIHASVESNAAGSHRGRLYVDISAGGSPYNAGYFDDSGLILSDDISAVDGIFSGDVSALSYTAERASGEVVSISATGSNSGNINQLVVKADDSASSRVDYTRVRSGVRINTAGNHAGRYAISVAQAGALEEALVCANGVFLPGSAGLASNRGFGSLDIDGDYYVRGVKVVGPQVVDADLGAPNSITPYTAATVSNPPTQAEVQAIANALEAAVTELSDVRAKLAAANSLLTTHGLGATS